MSGPCECSETRTFLDYRTGETVCVSCGLIRADSPMVGPDYVADNDASGHGPAAWSLVQRPILPSSLDAHGKPIPPNRRGEVWRLYREDVRAMSKQVGAGYSENDVRFMAQTAGLPMPAAVEAGRIHTRWRADHPRQSGLRNEDCAAAAILMASRIHKINIRTDSILSSTRAKQTGLWRAVNRLRRDTGIVDPLTLNPGAEPFIVSIAALFGVPARVREEARALLLNVKDFGYKPACFGAGAVFAAYEKLGITPPFGQVDVALAVGTTDTCLRNARRMIMEALSPTRKPPIVIL